MDNWCYDPLYRGYFTTFITGKGAKGPSCSEKPKKAEASLGSLVAPTGPTESVYISTAEAHLLLIGRMEFDISGYENV